LKVPPRRVLSRIRFYAVLIQIKTIRQQGYFAPPPLAHRDHSRDLAARPKLGEDRTPPNGGQAALLTLNGHSSWTQLIRPTYIETRQSRNLF